MSPSDLANGLFELGGCAVVARQCLLVWRARRVAGVSWEMPAFFWSWGVWNLWYYADLGQTLSWWAAVLVVITHSTYAALLWWFARNPGRTGFWGEVPAAATASPEAAGRIRDECGDLLDRFPCLRCGAHVPAECPFHRDHRP